MPTRSSKTPQGCVRCVSWVVHVIDYDPAWWPEGYPRVTAAHIAEREWLRAKNQAISKRVIGTVNTAAERAKHGIK